MQTTRRYVSKVAYIEHTIIITTMVTKYKSILYSLISIYFWDYFNLKIIHM